MEYNPYKTEELFFVATKCCFYHKDTILVVQEDRPGKPLWRELPGGKISKKDHSFSLIESLKREVSEELGWSLDMDESNTELFFVKKSYEHTTFSSEPVPFIFLCYFHSLDSIPEIQLSSEHQHFAWIREDAIGTFDDWRLGFDEIVKKAFLSKK